MIERWSEGHASLWRLNRHQSCLGDFSSQHWLSSKWTLNNGRELVSYRLQYSISWPQITVDHLIAWREFWTNSDEHSQWLKHKFNGAKTHHTMRQISLIRQALILSLALVLGLWLSLRTKFQSLVLSWPWLWRCSSCSMKFFSVLLNLWTCFH